MGETHRQHHDRGGRLEQADVQPLARVRRHGPAIAGIRRRLALVHGARVPDDRPVDEGGLYSGSENVATVAESGGPADPAHPSDSSPAPDQATQIADAVALAACQPYVRALFNFLLVDEVPLAGWQSGPLYPDLSHKTSYAAYQQAIGSAVGHTVDCASLKAARRAPTTSRRARRRTSTRRARAIR